VQHNIAGEDGKLLRTGTRTNQPHKQDASQEDPEQLYQQGLLILQKGTNSELKSLKIPVLLRLCQEHLPQLSNVQWSTLKKAELLTRLHNYVRNS
jgi:hypothetical protein